MGIIGLVKMLLYQMTGEVNNLIYWVASIVRPIKVKPPELAFDKEADEQSEDPSAVWLNPPTEDAEVPQEYQSMITQRHCGLCKKKLNSDRCASEHYNSKCHKRRVLLCVQRHVLNQRIEEWLIQWTCDNSTLEPDVLKSDVAPYEVDNKRQVKPTIPTASEVTAQLSDSRTNDKYYSVDNTDLEQNEPKKPAGNSLEDKQSEIKDKNEAVAEPKPTLPGTNCTYDNECSGDNTNLEPNKGKKSVEQYEGDNESKVKHVIPTDSQVTAQPGDTRTYCKHNSDDNTNLKQDKSEKSVANFLDVKKSEVEQKTKGVAKPRPTLAKSHRTPIMDSEIIEEFSKNGIESDYTPAGLAIYGACAFNPVVGSPPKITKKF